MTLTELKYIVAVARERHFGKTAQVCFVSQPTLSIAIKKLEDELETKLFERASNEVTPTPAGEKIVRQAQRVIEEAAQIKVIAKRCQDPLAEALSVGLIYTVAPYLLPHLMRQIIDRTPQMPLMLHENLTQRLLEMLRQGQIDCAILAEPFADTGLATAALYDEPYRVAVPRLHPLAQQSHISVAQLASEHLLLLGPGHRFRDHVLSVCPEHDSPDNRRHPAQRDLMQRSFEGSSLETIKHMVAAGMGITLVPRLAVPVAPEVSNVPMAANQKTSDAAHVKYLPLALAQGEIEPTRRIVLAWRRSFTRYEAIAALRNAVYACDLPDVNWLHP